jgi:hypothetical protein
MSLLRYGIRLAIAVVAAAAMLCALIQVHARYEAHRAKSILAKAWKVRIGDTEASVLPWVKQYRGYKWISGPQRREDLGRKEDCVDPEWCEHEIEYQLPLLPDYEYAVEVNPWGFYTLPNPQRSRLQDVLRAVINGVPAPLRSRVGMRDWLATVDIAIRGGRVSRVSAAVFVEGRSQWIGHEWTLAGEMPRYDMRLRSYTIDGAHLSFRNNGGGAVRHYLTPRAPEDVVQAARSVNTACLTSFLGCRGMCDLSGRTVQYLKTHPDETWNIRPPECR